MIGFCHFFVFLKPVREKSYYSCYWSPCSLTLLGGWEKETEAECDYAWRIGGGKRLMNLIQSSKKICFLKTLTIKRVCSGWGPEQTQLEVCTDWGSVWLCLDSSLKEEGEPQLLLLSIRPSVSIGFKHPNNMLFQTFIRLEIVIWCSAFIFALRKKNLRALLGNLHRIMQHVMHQLQFRLL